MLKIAFTKQQLQKLVAIGVEMLQDVKAFYLQERAEGESFSQTLDRYYNEVFSEDGNKKEN